MASEEAGRTGQKGPGSGLECANCGRPCNGLGELVEHDCTETTA